MLHVCTTLFHLKFTSTFSSSGESGLVYKFYFKNIGDVSFYCECYY